MQTKDELNAENLLLKLKLEMEHGMIMSDTSKLDPETENQWLSNIHEFEKQFEAAKQIKVYDLIGRPDFKPYNELTEKETDHELTRLLNILQESQISLSCICEYENETIYRFLTEEFFDHEVDNIMIEGMIHHFIYEEFHPNHDYDLRRSVTEFIDNVLQKKWNPEFDHYGFATSVTFRGKEYDRLSISKIIQTFQETFHPINMNVQSIEHVEIDLENQFASVRLQLSYSSQADKGKVLTYTGNSFISFKMEYDYWNISHFQLPGFGD